MYIDEHGEGGPPTAEEWETIIALARKSVTQTRSQTEEDPDRDPTNVHSKSTVLGGTLMYLPTHGCKTCGSRHALSTPPNTPYFLSISPGAQPNHTVGQLCSNRELSLTAHT